MWSVFGGFWKHTTNFWALLIFRFLQFLLWWQSTLYLAPGLTRQLHVQLMQLSRAPFINPQQRIPLHDISNIYRKKQYHVILRYSIYNGIYNGKVVNGILKKCIKFYSMLQVLGLPASIVTLNWYVLFIYCSNVYSPIQTMKISTKNYSKLPVLVSSRVCCGKQSILSSPNWVCWIGFIRMHVCCQWFSVQFCPSGDCSLRVLISA